MIKQAQINRLIPKLLALKSSEAVLGFFFDQVAPLSAQHLAAVAVKRVDGVEWFSSPAGVIKRARRSRHRWLTASARQERMFLNGMWHYVTQQESGAMQFVLAPAAEAADRRLTRADELLLDSIARQFELLCRLEQMEANTHRDDLTCVYNQNYIKRILQNEIKRVHRYGGMFAVVFLDIDGLKAINDLHSHLMGSKLLQELAALLIQSVRDSDLVARFGGDEFVVLLLHSSTKQAWKVCQRMQKTIAGHHFLGEHHLDVRITASFGIAGSSPAIATADEILKQADLAMYSVKNSGKNNIKIYQGDQ
jgi:diguanylate cyclase (GGDEF)-like protein